jgi:hypothetical protein
VRQIFLPSLAMVKPSLSVPPSSIRNKVKREAIYRKNKRANGREKLEKRLARAKVESSDPEAKRVHLVSFMFTTDVYLLRDGRNG